MDPMQPTNNVPQNSDAPQDPMTPAPQPTQPPVVSQVPDQPMSAAAPSFNTTAPVQTVDPQMPLQPTQPIDSMVQPSVQPTSPQPVVPPIVPVQPDPMNNPFQQQNPVDPFAAQQPQQMQPDFSAPVPPSAPGWKKFIKPAIIIAIAIIVLIGGYFAFTFISSKFQKVVTTNNTNQVAQSTKANVPEINTLKKFTMLAPDASKTQGMTSTQAEAATAMTSADGGCTLIYGIETQQQLPGTDIGDVISQYLAKLKTQSPHLVVNGPNQAAALVLAGTDGKSYSLPTVNFTYTDSTQAGAANGIYSVSQLSDGSHAVVASICGSDTAKTAAELQSKVASLQQAAATIKVQVQ